MEIFLILNGYELFVNVNEQEKVMLELADGKLTRVDFEEWLSKHITHITNE